MAKGEIPSKDEIREMVRREALSILRSLHTEVSYFGDIQIGHTASNGKFESLFVINSYDIRRSQIDRD